MCLLPRSGHIALLGVFTERVAQHLHRGDAVGNCVMDLGVDSEASVAQALDEVHLPQRPAPVEERFVQPRAQRHQLGLGARSGQGVVADVVLEVEFVDRLPAPLTERGQGPAGTLGQFRGNCPGAFGERAVEHGADVVRVGTLRRLEDFDTADMHRMLARLAEEEHRVER